MRRLCFGLGGLGLAVSLEACASGGGGHTVVHYGVGPGWGPWGGYYGGPPLPEVEW